MVEHLLCNHKALSSNSSCTKKQQQKKKTDLGGVFPLSLAQGIFKSLASSLCLRVVPGRTQNRWPGQLGRLLRTSPPSPLHGSQPAFQTHLCLLPLPAPKARLHLRCQDLVCARMEERFCFHLPARMGCFIYPAVHLPLL
jgi:hypothetical protein